MFGASKHHSEEKLVRNPRKTAILIASVTLLSAMTVWAQKVELAIGAGGYFPVNLSGAGNAAAIEGSAAYRVASVPFVSAYVEVPVVASFDTGFNATLGPGFGPTLSSSYSALFVAPGLRVKISPGFWVSPWLAVGGGLAHFSPSSGLRAAGADSTNTGVFDYGGGLDWKIAPFISARTEVRDFYSGGLGFNLANFNQRQHNIVATAGLVLRF
jgi:hypothetical protein